MLFFLFSGLFWSQWRHRKYDPLTREYHRLQREIKRLQIFITPKVSLAKQWQEIGRQHPELAPLLNQYLKKYEKLRLRDPKNNSVDNRKATQLLFRSLRDKLKKFKKSSG